MEHDMKLSANPEADQLWKNFARRLDKVTEENLLDLMTEDLFSRVTDPKNIQCLSYKALADIMGKVQVLQGEIEVMQLQSVLPPAELQMLHARLQVLCGKMLPYLAVRIKQAPVPLLKKPIEARRSPAAADTVPELSSHETESNTSSEDTEPATEVRCEQPTAASSAKDE
jgi:hypothetical protein